MIRKVFGRRGAVVPQPAATGERPDLDAWRRMRLEQAYAEIDEGTRWSKPGWREGVLFFVLVIAGLLIPDAMLFGDLAPEAADLKPGLRVALAPYVAPDGCPSRLNWRPGDWVAWPCRHKGNVLREWRLRDYGLGEPRRHRGGRRNRRDRAMEQEWVRVGPDALLIRCGRLIGCRVTRVVADRFVESGGGPKPALSATP